MGAEVVNQKQKRPVEYFEKKRSLDSRRRTFIAKATLIYYDNISIVYLSDNPVQYHCMKHIGLNIHFVREKVARGQVRVLYVPSHFRIVDIFTKGLSL